MPSASTIIVTMTVLLLLLVVALAAAPSSAAGETTPGRPSPSLVPLIRARPSHRRRPAFFQGRAAGGCMPRGLHRMPPSAPSRYANYHTLDAGGVCGGHRPRKP
ncbi:hypothetical protein ACP4OV_029001 [Aristida adscensionis]